MDSIILPVSNHLIRKVIITITHWVLATKKQTDTIGSQNYHHVKVWCFCPHVPIFLKLLNILPPLFTAQWVLPTLLYGEETWTVKADSVRKSRGFHNESVQEAAMEGKDNINTIS